MIAGLRDNHARWDYLAPPPGYAPGDLGIMTSPSYLLADPAPQEALQPLFVTAVEPGSPADGHGVRPGDIIVSVNAAPPFADGIISGGVMNLLYGPYPAGRPGVGAAAPARHRPHLDGDPDTRAQPGPPSPEPRAIIARPTWWQ
jgi:carboxyl-terminal processing protease